MALLIWFSEPVNLSSSLSNKRNQTVSRNQAMDDEELRGIYYSTDVD